jgi:hypothetical protein
MNLAFTITSLGGTNETGKDDCEKTKKKAAVQHAAKVLKQ